jgi:enoyl-CoA hydratase/carnithine racemase
LRDNQAVQPPSLPIGEIRLKFDGELAVVSLSNPAKLNAMSRHMWQQLSAVFESIQVNKNAGCVLVYGENCDALKSFSAGGDISEYPSFRFDETTLHDFHEIDVWGGLQAMLACDLPIVAQIEGACMGAGLEIASCCDIRIAGASATFGAPIAKLGFPMAPKEAALVLKAVGAMTAREMLLEAAVLDAASMQTRGFLNRVVPDAEVAQTAMQSVNRILALAPQAARLNKQTFRGLSTQNPYAYAQSAEHKEGIDAFIDKRKPDWPKN